MEPNTDLTFEYSFGVLAILKSSPSPNEYHAEPNEHAGQSGAEALLHQRPVRDRRKAEEEDSGGRKPLTTVMT